MKRRDLGCEYSVNALAAGRRCRHGWPQALVYDPIFASGRLADTVRLTCPLLVEAIDKYEKAGAIQRLNDHLLADRAWQEELLNINVAHRDLRRQLVEHREEELSNARSLMGGEVVDIVMETGLASMRLNSTDVKCLHAHVADELTRGGNIIGQQVLQDLTAGNFDVSGTNTCCDHCNVDVPLGEGRWTLRNSKNKLGQRLRKLQRKRGQVRDVPAEND